MSLIGPYAEFYVKVIGGGAVPTDVFNRLNSHPQLADDGPCPSDEEKQMILSVGDGVGLVKQRHVDAFVERVRETLGDRLEKIDVPTLSEKGFLDPEVENLFVIHVKEPSVS